MRHRRAGLDARRKQLAEARAVLEDRKRVVVLRHPMVQGEDDLAPPHTALDAADSTVEGRGGLHGGGTKERADATDPNTRDKRDDGDGEEEDESEMYFTTGRGRGGGGADEKATVVAPRPDVDMPLRLQSALVQERRCAIGCFMKLHLIRRHNQHVCLIHDMPLPDDCSAIGSFLHNPQPLTSRPNNPTVILYLLPCLLSL